ncbi:MAG TPA: hypothetical protein VHY08_02995 [Bacillota bacterium]|nr:hypothetical protein [Bacillota bacterium]
MKRNYLFGAVIFCILFFCSTGLTAGGKNIRNIKLDHTSFNPSVQEKCELSYELAQAAKVSVWVYTADFDLIKILANNVSQKKGNNKAVWDGTDLAGNVVPNEAYFFCIEATLKGGAKEIYDPTTFSGGEEFDVTEVEYDKLDGLFKFSLPKPARILMRIGIKDGPLIATLADWEPRSEGHNLVYWTGFDPDKVFDARGRTDLSLLTTGFNLPDCSVIAYGNQKVDYFSYKKTLKAPLKPLREETFRAVKISPNYYYPRTEDRAPVFQIELPEASNQTPRVKEQLAIRIIVTDEFKQILLKNRFEVSLFLDGQFLFEEEEGYTPFNIVWNSHGVEPGEHYLTIALSTYLGQVSSKTLKIDVERD